MGTKLCTRCKHISPERRIKECMNKDTILKSKKKQYSASDALDWEWHSNISTYYLLDFIPCHHLRHYDLSLYSITQCNFQKTLELIFRMIHYILVGWPKGITISLALNVQHVLRRMFLQGTKSLLAKISSERKVYWLVKIKR